MSSISTFIETTKQIDADGNEQITTNEQTKKTEVCTEPDYIKLYTNMWCEFNEIPVIHRPLFLELVTRMTYCDKNDLNNSQIVAIGGPVTTAICKTLKWKNKDSLKKGLKALIDCNAIKRIDRGWYQINPQYAGKGEWKFNPRLNRGGIEDLIATFNFKERTVETTIIWSDDGTEDPFNRLMREGLKCKPSDKTVITFKQILKK